MHAYYDKDSCTVGSTEAVFIIPVPNTGNKPNVHHQQWFSHIMECFIGVTMDVLEWNMARTMNLINILLRKRRRKTYSAIPFITFENWTTLLRDTYISGETNITKSKEKIITKDDCSRKEKVDYDWRGAHRWLLSFQWRSIFWYRWQLHSPFIL